MADAHLYVLWDLNPLASWQRKPLFREIYWQLNRWANVDSETGKWVENLPGDLQPPHRLHYRVSQNHRMAITEALLDTDKVNLNTAATWLANKLNDIEPPIIGQDDDGNPIYPPDPRPYTANQIKSALRDRVTIFGGLGATWEESRQACLAFLADKAPAWGVAVVIILAPQDISGMEKPPGEYRYLVDIGDYSLWAGLADVNVLLGLHDTLWQMAPTKTLGLLAAMETFGESFYPHRVRIATGMTVQQALARRDRIADYLDSLGHDAADLRAATNEYAQMVGIVVALGFTMAQLWNTLNR